MSTIDDQRQPKVGTSGLVCDEPPQSPQYRLVLSHADWTRPTRTKWQASSDFSKALAKAAELGVTAEIETSHTLGMWHRRRRCSNPRTMLPAVDHQPLVRFSELPTNYET